MSDKKHITATEVRERNKKYFAEKDKERAKKHFDTLPVNTRKVIEELLDAYKISSPMLTALFYRPILIDFGVHQFCFYDYSRDAYLYIVMSDEDEKGFAKGFARLVTKFDDEDDVDMVYRQLITQLHKDAQ